MIEGTGIIPVVCPEVTFIGAGYTTSCNDNTEDAKANDLVNLATAAVIPDSWHTAVALMIENMNSASP